MGTDLKWVSVYVKKHSEEVLTSLYHHVVDVDNLRSCFERLNGAKVVGIDGVTKEEYGEHLEEELVQPVGPAERHGV